MSSNRLTEKQLAISRSYARLGDIKAVALETGAHPSTVRNALAKPKVADEVVRARQTLAGDLLPMAIESARRSLQRHIAGEPEPAALVSDARRHVFEYALPKAGEHEAKEPHEMTADELSEAIERLEAEAAGRAKPVADPGIFE